MVVAPERRKLGLEPGARVSYRLSPLAPGSFRLVGRAASAGTLELDWVAVEAGETETPCGGERLAVSSANDVELERELPAVGGLLELSLTWRAPPGSASLVLTQLALVDSTPVERPSIVLIVIDTLSAGHLSAYGYPLETDPELKRFASESYLFEACHANAPWTVPSFLALFTGLYGRAHEVAGAGSELWEHWILAPNRWTLAEALRSAGYRTAAFVDSTFLSRRIGFGQGFDLYDESATRDNGRWPLDPDGGIRRTAELARDFLEPLGNTVPFFVFVHALDVHQPFGEKPPVAERARGREPYSPERVARVGGSVWCYEMVNSHTARSLIPKGQLPATIHTASLERAYDEGVRFLDLELGRFLDALERKGVLERSWVVITADHGESMADGVHYFGHATMSQEVLHVPLVMRPPGGVPGGRRIAQTVQLADLHPTLLELAGLPAQAAPLHGRSLVPLLRGAEREPGVVFAEGGNTRQAALLFGGWKLIELEPTLDAPVEARISHPRLRPVLAALAARLQEEPIPPRMVRRHRWLRDLELRRDVLERMPVTGLTEALLEQMTSRKRFRSFLAFTDHALRGPFYELYRLEEDPSERRDLAAQHPEKVAELRALLEIEKARRAQACELAELPREPVQLEEAAIEALRALGYGGGGGDE